MKRTRRGDSTVTSAVTVAFKFRSMDAWLLVLLSLCGHGASAQLSEDLIATELERAAKNPDHRVEFTTAAPPGYVFNYLLTRLDDYSEAVQALRFDSAAASEPPSIGSLRVSTMAGGGELTQRILLLDEAREYAYFTDMAASTVNVPLNYSVGRYRFSETENGGTRVVVGVAYQPSSRLFGFVIRRAFNRSLRRDFERAAQLIDRDYAHSN